MSTRPLGTKANVVTLATAAMVFAPVGHAFAQTPVVDGRWSVAVEGASRSGIITFVLTTTGPEITGRREVTGGAVIPVTGEVQGDQVVLRFTVLENDREVPVEIEAELSANRLDGQALIVLPEDRSVTRRWTATRIDAEPSETGPSVDPPSPSLAVLLRSTVERTGWPGITVAWHRTDGTSGSEAAGLADLGSQQPMTVTSRMPAGSVGKTFVSAITLQLASEGVVELDSPVSAVLGDRAWFDAVPNADDLTLRHLLQHSGGLPDHVADADFAAMGTALFANPDQPASPEDLVRTLADNPPLFPAGQSYGYSDTGYLLVGLVLEASTGQAWWDLLRHRALAPAGLEHSHAQDRRDFPQLATGYPDTASALAVPATIVRDGRFVVHPGTEWTGGGVVSTTPDLARWAVALYGGRFLPEAVLQEMLSSSAPGSDYALGVRVGTSDWGTWMGHDGWFPGYRTKLTFFPRHGVAVAIQVNTDRDVDLDPVLQDVLTVLIPRS